MEANIMRFYLDEECQRRLFFLALEENSNRDKDQDNEKLNNQGGSQNVNNSND